MEPIQLPNLWNAFRTKFGWEMQQPREIFLNPVIQPVTVIDDVMDYTMEVISASIYHTGWSLTTITEVPFGEIWNIHSICVYVGGGNMDLYNLQVGKTAASEGVIMRGGLGTQILETGMITPFRLKAGDKIGYTVSNLTGAGAVWHNIHYRKQVV